MKLTALHAFNGLAEAEREWAIMKCLEIAKRHGRSSYVSQVKVCQNSSKRLLAQRTSTLWLCTSPDIVCTRLGERASGSRDPCYNYGGRGQPGVCVGGEGSACVLCPCSCRYVCVYCIYVSLCIDDLP